MKHQRIDPSVRQEWYTYKRHSERCTRCDISRTCRNKVLFRGVLPCDILLIAEAPGPSEDVLGLPLIGPAGRLFNTFLRIFDDNGLTYALTNTLLCYPTQRDKRRFRKPTRDEMVNCWENLSRFIELSRATTIVAVGGVAESFLKSRQVPDLLSVPHPSAILQSGEDHANWERFSHMTISVFKEIVKEYQ